MKSSNFLVFLQLSYDIETFFDMFQAFEHIWVIFQMNSRCGFWIIQLEPSGDPPTLGSLGPGDSLLPLLAVFGQESLIFLGIFVTTPGPTGQSGWCLVRSVSSGRASAMIAERDANGQIGPTKASPSRFRRENNLHPLKQNNNHCLFSGFRTKNATNIQKKKNIHQLIWHYIINWDAGSWAFHPKHTNSSEGSVQPQSVTTKLAWQQPQFLELWHSWHTDFSDADKSAHFLSGRQWRPWRPWSKTNDKLKWEFDESLSLSVSLSLIYIYILEAGGGWRKLAG